jgi:NADP-dependent 3-hydroxy acid dehydrogenase YdfG
MAIEKKTVCITGATSGIGLATAKLLGKKGYRLIICGRRKDRLEKLANELSETCEITILNFDIRNKEACFSAFENLPNSFKNIDVLINNAGNAHGLANFQTGEIDDWDAMIDINVKGLLYVSKCIVPSMVERKSGQIINIGSVAGKETYPNGNVYCASKYAVDALTESMRKDLNPYGIKVGQICPGLVETEFSEVRFKGDKEKAATVYKDLDALQAEDIAEIIDFCIHTKAHVNIADLLVFPTAQASATIINRKL